MRSLVVLSLVLCGHGVAAAEDTAKADQIFEQAQQLKAQGKHVEACARYEQSLSYNPNAVGTLLNVGLCAEQAGKYATAVRHYTLARDLAREHALEEHRVAAEERLALASPHVAHLAIAFADQAEDMKLVIGEEIIPVGKADDIVLDPGSHHIVVSAPGRVSYETTIELAKGKAKAIAIPRLDYPVVHSGRRTAGKILTFGGAALTVAGIGLGVYGRSLYMAQLGDMSMGANCSDESPPKCNPEGYRKTSDARTYGTFGTIIGFAGIAAAGAGAYLWFFAPSDSGAERNVAVVPTVTPELAGLSAVGRF